MKNASARVVDGCARYNLSLDAYVDSELDADHAADVRTHVVDCRDCGEQVEMLRAIRASVQRTSQRATCPDLLRAKLCATMTRERSSAPRDGRDARDSDALGPKINRLKYAVGVAAAAGVVFAMGMSRYSSQERAMASAAATDSAVLSFEGMLNDLVANHANPLPPETRNPDDLDKWDPYVGVPVRRPEFKPFDGNFSGARMLGNADRRSAMLQYTVRGGHRVTIYVFNPRNMPLQQATALAPRVVRQRPVLVGKMRGYSVAAMEESGVGYALANDGDEDETTKLVAAIR